LDATGLNVSTNDVTLTQRTLRQIPKKSRDNWRDRQDVVFELLIAQLVLHAKGVREDAPVASFSVSFSFGYMGSPCRGDGLKVTTFAETWELVKRAHRYFG
jgi:hypothetical protein